MQNRLNCTLCIDNLYDLLYLEKFLIMKILIILLIGFSFPSISQNLNYNFLPIVPFKNAPRLFVKLHEGNLFFIGSKNAFKEVQHLTKYSIESQSKEEYSLGAVGFDDYVGYMKDIFYIGDYSFEVLKLVNKKKPNEHIDAVIRRNINSSDKIDVKLVIDKYTRSVNPTPFGTIDYLNVEVFSSKTGFYVVRRASIGKLGEGNFIAKYNENMEEQWRKDFSFINEEGISLDQISVDESDNLIVPIKMENQDRKWAFKTRVIASSLAFYILTEAGEDMVISPEISQNVYPQNSKYRFFPKQKELVGFYQTSKIEQTKVNTTITGNGYSYFRWDEEGSIISEKHYYFTLDDLKNPSMDNFLKNYKKDYSIFTERKGELRRLISGGLISITDNQEVVYGTGSYLIQENYPSIRHIEEIKSCKFLYRIGNDGNLIWKNFIPDVADVSGFQHASISFSDETIVIATIENSNNFSSNGYKITNSKPYKKQKNPVLAIRKIDFKTGEIEYFEPVINNSEVKLLPGIRLLLDKKTKIYYFISYDEKNKNFQLLNVSLN